MSDSDMRDPFAGGSGGPYVKYDEVGDDCAGVITDVEVKKETDDNNKVKTFDDGSARPLVILHLTLDDGTETRDFVKGRSVTALRKAVHAEEGEGKGPQAGARYTRKLVEKNGGPSKKENMFELTYTAAAAGSGSEDRTFA